MAKRKPKETKKPKKPESQSCCDCGKPADKGYTFGKNRFCDPCGENYVRRGVRAETLQDADTSVHKDYARLRGSAAR